MASCRKTSRGVTDGVRGGVGDRIRRKRKVNIGRVECRGIRKWNRIKDSVLVFHTRNSRHRTQQMRELLHY